MSHEDGAFGIVSVFEWQFDEKVYFQKKLKILNIGPRLKILSIDLRRLKILSINPKRLKIKEGQKHAYEKNESKEKYKDE